MLNHVKTIGILGGMGPEAGSEVFMRIVSNFRKQSGEDHLRSPHIILNSINNVGPTMPWQHTRTKAGRKLYYH